MSDPLKPNEFDDGVVATIGAIEHDEESRSRRAAVYRFVAWAVAVSVFTGFVALARVHTRLGVEAPTADKNGREYVWRVWWRARNDIVEIGPDVAVTVVYVCLALAFVALSMVAFWLALVPDESGRSGQSPPDQPDPL